MIVKRKILMASMQVVSQFGNYKGLAFAEFSEKMREEITSAAKPISEAIKKQYSPEQADFLKSMEKEVGSLAELKKAVSGRADAEDLLRLHNEAEIFMEGEVEVPFPSIARADLPSDISVAHYSFLKGLGVVAV